MHDHIDSTFEGLSGRNEIAPLTREQCVCDICDAVQRKEPHEEKVICQTLRKLKLEMKYAVEPPGEKTKKCPASGPDPVDLRGVDALVLRVCPVNKDSGVDHQE